MLCAIRKSDDKKVLASEESKSNRPFYCPRCEDEAILKKGTVKIHHFAHKPPVTCEYGRGETEKHRLCKMAIFEGLKEYQRFRNVELEKGLGTVRPDISAVMGDVPIAIEVQISTLTMDQIVYRTKEYAKKGIYLLWLPIYNIYLETNRYSPKLWERWIHAAYFGRVYYWVGGIQALPYHFGESTHYVESRSWYNPRWRRRVSGRLRKELQALSHTEERQSGDSQSQFRSQIPSRALAVENTFHT
jgi:competence protein CoiA